MGAPHRPFAERLPQRRRKIAWLAAVGAPLALTASQRIIGSEVPPAAALFATLLVVVVVALIGGVGPALTAVTVGLLAQETLFTFPYGSLDNHEPAQIAVLVVFVLVGAGIGILVDELARLTAEQAALKRIATLVARGVPPAELFSAVAKEVAALLTADGAVVVHLEPDGFVTLLAVEGRAAEFAVGERLQVEPPMASAIAMLSGRPARADDYKRGSPELQRRLLRAGIRASVAGPILVEGHVWGSIVAVAERGPLPPDSEERMLNFAELVATAIADAESRTELVASRVRIVTAADETRRRIERDLHDGVQQRLVSLALDIRAAQSALPPTAPEVRSELSRIVTGLTETLSDLREISRGIHPAILSDGGLGPALRTLARRAAIPVALDVRLEERLSDGIEVAAYYAVAELVTNSVKHSNAPAVDVTVTRTNGALHILVHDDGIGGADPSRGSGLIGLRDRVEALGGTISVRSPNGEGTVVEVALPLSG